MKLAVRSLLALALTLPALSFASSIDFANQGGTLSGSSAGLTLAGSHLVAIQIDGGTLFTGNLGTVSFTTAGLTTGTLATGGTFGPSGVFAINGDGMDGFPNGPIFTGTFSGPVQWAEITLGNGTHNYTLTGALSGIWYTGQSVTGATVQLTVNTGKGVFTGTGIRISSGDTNVNTLTTPEPSSLSLLGTGLLAFGGLLRHKLRVV